MNASAVDIDQIERRAKDAGRHHHPPHVEEAWRSELEIIRERVPVLVAETKRARSSEADGIKAAEQILWHFGTDADRLAMDPALKWKTDKEEAVAALRSFLAKAKGEG